MRELRDALAGAALIGGLMTAGDWAWAHFELPHRAIFGLLHGLALCCGIGLFLGVPRRQKSRGATTGAAIGLGAATCFYALAPLLRWTAMVPAWMALWIAFAILLWRFLGEPKASMREAIAQGLMAAVPSGPAFHAISGIWTQPNPDGPNYLKNFGSWTLALTPGFPSLLIDKRGKP